MVHAWVLMILTGNIASILRPFIDSWGTWCTWGTCSVQCGSGIRTRVRHCNRPGGCLELGANEETETCCTESCPTTADTRKFIKAIPTTKLFMFSQFICPVFLAITFERFNGKRVCFIFLKYDNSCA